MTGLFLNFYQVQLSGNSIQLRYLSYEDYETKEDFVRLRKEYSNCFFYREGDKIIFWSLSNSLNIPSNWKPIEISLTTSPKVFAKIMEDCVMYFISTLNTYRLFKNNYSNTWDIVSGKDVLNGRIAGLELNRVVHFTPYFFFKDNVLIFGLTLSTSVKNRFTWSKQEFEANGVDTKGLKGDDENIYPNKQSLKRFLETKGVATTYENVIRTENDKSKSVTTINAFYEWLSKKKSEIILPGKISINTILKRYIPFEDNLIKSEVLYKPQRYFYSNSKNIQGLKYYDQMVKAYKPYSLELYQNKKMKFGVICPKEFQGETEAFLKQIEFKLKDTFHFTDIAFNIVPTKGKALENYKDVLYDNNLLESDLVYVIVSKDHEKLAERNSPYHVCKAKLIGNGIPTQDIQIETIRKQYSAFTMTNITLNTYAKLGGTAWTIEKEDKLREELIVGVGSTIGEDGHHVLGIAQVFHNDGRYILGDCAPLSTFSDYSENLENHLYSTLKSIVEEMQKSGTFRLIFHLYKSASEKYEIKAIHNLQQRFSQYNFEFALVHLGYGHNFRLYFNEGLNDINQGTYIQLSKHSALLHFVSKSDLPLKIDLDKRSTFTSLFYLAKQIYWFSHLSHRSYMPSKRTVTIMYPSLMARMTEELKKVEGWDYDRLKAVSEKLWFI